MSNGHHDKKIDAFYAQEETVESLMLFALATKAAATLIKQKRKSSSIL